MTKETKIGLLVGLTFIILFAIILSKGPNSTKSTTNMTIADAHLPDSSSRIGGAQTKRLESSRSKRFLPTPISSDQASRSNITMFEEPVEGQAIPGEDTPIEPLPDSVISRLNIPMVELEVPIEEEVVNDDASAELGNSVVAALNGTPPSVVSHDSEHSSIPPFANIGPTSTSPSLTPNQGSSTNRPHTPSAGSGPNASPNLNLTSPSTVPITTPAPAKPTRLIAEHEVKPGESLGKIAAKYYGRSTPTRVDAIFDANRDQLDSVNAVKAKTTLKIPLLEGEFAGMFEAVDGLAPRPIQNSGSANNPRVNPSVAGNSGRRDNTILIPIPVDERSNRDTANAHTGRPPNSPTANRPLNIQPPKATEIKFTWYEIREKDTLSKIAKSQLGNEKKYRDIYKLNSDILPDQHKLKPGVKIRLPLKEKPASTGTMMTTSLAIDPSAEQSE
ncbi:MAG: LysM peptidoglycan-binding domain-containing protein [Planctomycetes bacterium]|nr:LysM peptidoglycan-binding domain-containing protein [Planctomycetota bacterium]